MEIKRKSDICRTSFDSLAEGDTFRATSYDVIWMKTEYIETADDEGWNAVDLSNGEMGWFDKRDLVTPVKINAVIED